MNVYRYYFKNRGILVHKYQFSLNPCGSIYRVDNFSDLRGKVMPLFPYSCTCGTVGDLITKVDEIPNCPKCGRPMKREFHSKFGINRGPVPTAGMYDENLGCFIRTNQHRKEVMREQGVSEKPSKRVWFR